MSDYYRSATDVEVDSFAKSEKLSIEDSVAFRGMANTWIRRKIAMINDSQVLVNYTASEIKMLAAESGIDIDIKEEAIVIPNDKEKVKVILGFLDEAAYKGPFSQKHIWQILNALLGNKDIGYDPSPLYHRVYYSQTLTINRAPTAWPVPYSYRSHL